MTNANFFAFCMKVSDLLKSYDGTDPEKTRAKATSARIAQLRSIWFRLWFKQQASPLKIPYEYLHTLYPDSPVALVETQPHTDLETGPEYTYGSKDHSLSYPGTVWTGDQGPVACALSCFLLNNRTPKQNPSVVGAIAQGSWNAFGNSEQKLRTVSPIGRGDSIIRDPPTTAVFSDAGDYVVGRSVTCRFFAEPGTHAVLASSSVNWVLKTHLGYMFHATVDAATVGGRGNLVPDMGGKEGMEASIRHFNAAWENDYRYRTLSGGASRWNRGAWLAFQSHVDSGEGEMGMEMQMDILVVVGIMVTMGIGMGVIEAMEGSKWFSSRT